MSTEPLYFSEGVWVCCRDVQTGPGRYTLGGPFLIARSRAEAAEVARRFNVYDELVAALRGARDAIEKADPAVLVCTLWMPDAAAETVVDRIDRAISAAEGRADG